MSRHTGWRTILGVVTYNAVILTFFLVINVIPDARNVCTLVQIGETGTSVVSKADGVNRRFANLFDKKWLRLLSHFYCYIVGLERTTVAKCNYL